MPVKLQGPFGKHLKGHIHGLSHRDSDDNGGCRRGRSFCHHHLGKFPISSEKSETLPHQPSCCASICFYSLLSFIIKKMDETPADSQVAQLSWQRILQLDAEDPLKHLRAEFIIPSKADLKRKTLTDHGESSHATPIIKPSGLIGSVK